MQPHIKSHLRSIASLTAVLAILTIGSQLQTAQFPSTNDIWRAQIGGLRSFTRAQRNPYPKSQKHRIALRLQKRLRRKGNRATPSVDVLAKAVESRQKLLSRNITVTFSTDEDSEHTVWDVSAQKYPLWISPSITMNDAKFVMNPDQIKKSFEDESIVTVNPPIHAILRNVQLKEDDRSVSRATIEGTAHNGYLPDTDLIASSIAKTFHTDLEEISIPLEKEEGRIINMTDLDLGDLRLWATGRSDYRGSTYARSYNVQKALNEHVQNTVVAPGDTYSFNSTLNGPVSVANGWRMAKVIFNGGDLEPAPGGGICQASTTVFRAIVNAGFPIVERRSHSLYVSYYKKHGVGIDATIYPGSQDLTFLNDTDNYLVIQSYNEGSEAFVNIFGTPDGRTVALEGPYFTSTAPDGFSYRGRGIATNEIVWVQSVNYSNGENREYQIGSRYKTLPQSLAREYEPAEVIHTSAPLAQVNE
ncbi:MAG: VanW family protein [Candidatus Peribacteraceae bacterium]|nr:VanW family protein [Candidatus Peribacteraceae bacterium]